MSAYNYTINIDGSQVRGFEKCSPDCACSGSCAEEERFIEALFASVEPIRLTQEFIEPITTTEIIANLSVAAADLSQSIATMSQILETLEQEGRV